MYKVKIFKELKSSSHTLEGYINTFLETLDDSYVFVDLKHSSTESYIYAIVILKYIHVRKMLTEKTHV